LAPEAVHTSPINEKRLKTIWHKPIKNLTQKTELATLSFEAPMFEPSAPLKREI